MGKWTGGNVSGFNLGLARVRKKGENHATAAPINRESVTKKLRLAQKRLGIGSPSECRILKTIQRFWTV
jgi:hypothetical protein